MSTFSLFYLFTCLPLKLPNLPTCITAKLPTSVLFCIFTFPSNYFYTSTLLILFKYKSIRMICVDYFWLPYVIFICNSETIEPAFAKYNQFLTPSTQVNWMLLLITFLFSELSFPYFRNGRTYLFQKLINMSPYQ